MSDKPKNAPKEENPGAEEQQQNQPADEQPEQEVGNRVKFKVLSDLCYNNKRYLPGDDVNLKGLDKRQIQRLIDGGVIE